MRSWLLALQIKAGQKHTFPHRYDAVFFGRTNIFGIFNDIQDSKCNTQGIQYRPHVSSIATTWHARMCCNRYCLFFHSTFPVILTKWLIIISLERIQYTCSLLLWDGIDSAWSLESMFQHDQIHRPSAISRIKLHFSRSMVYLNVRILFLLEWHWFTNTCVESSLTTTTINLIFHHRGFWFSLLNVPHAWSWHFTSRLDSCTPQQTNNNPRKVLLYMVNLPHFT